MKTGLEMRQRREKLGIRQEDLADAVGTDAETISRWENGVHKPHKIKYERWDAALRQFEDPTATQGNLLCDELLKCYCERPVVRADMRRGMFDWCPVNAPPLFAIWDKVCVDDSSVSSDVVSGDQPMDHQRHPCYGLCDELAERWKDPRARDGLRMALLALCPRTAPAVIEHLERLLGKQGQKKSRGNTHGRSAMAA